MTAPHCIDELYIKFAMALTSTARVIHLAPSLQVCQQQQGNRSVFRRYTAAVVDHRHSTAISAGTDDYKFCLHNTCSHLIINFWHRSFTFNSNKSPNWCNNFSVYYPDVCLQLNMFRAFIRPPSGAQWLQWGPLVLPSYRGDSSVVFVVGPAGPTTNTARLSPQYEGKIRGSHCSHWAPDDGRENARNMLSCKQTSG